ncbi:circadian clock protein KaiA [Phormidium sp. CLA17]|uniref:circadian clock protein KaiA n=1 Tax=Leptolyngbya sp. Cla-17 TaxID=2803751 RepID=UPI0014926291|nr:circadian clock protein KaiA [Leptolyngbya sp. Cla-17]MBM0743500.1 circadian clock protein KaiA [Leptolyngbya sp. Cla-17]
MSSPLSIGLFLSPDFAAQALLNALNHDRYRVCVHTANDQFCGFIDQERQQLDCLILQSGSELSHLIHWLHGQVIVLPAVILHTDLDEMPIFNSSSVDDRDSSTLAPFTYHTAEFHTTPTQFNLTDDVVEQAIARFIHLSPNCRIGSSVEAEIAIDSATQTLLMLQQRRLIDKLKERLGYLGVYYKRNPQSFFRRLPVDQQQKLSEKLKAEYRDILLCYFTNDGTLNQQIDDFINTSFFADMSVPQIVEIHMDLIDDISKQLKLEGRSEEIVLDYRLTLIDIIAHLCEMYRRSIPRET